MSGQVTDTLGQDLLAILHQLTSAGSAILYLPVRLTNGQAFYIASGGTGGTQSPIKIQTSAGTALLVIDSNGRIGINNFPSNYFQAGQSIGNTGFNANNLLNPHPVKVQTSSGTAFLVVDSSGKIGVNNFPASFKVQTSSGTALLIINSDGSVNVISKQTTRTNLTVQPERQDLTSIAGQYSPNAAGVQVVAGVSGKQIKVFVAAYEILAAGLHCFYFGTGTSMPAGLPNKYAFLLASAVGRTRQLYGNPIIGSAGSGLYLYSTVSESNMPADVQFVQE